MESEDTEKFHPVVDLLLARMDSHPEEFMPPGIRGNHGQGRMRNILESVQRFLTPQEKAALKAKERETSLNLIHIAALKQIVSGK